MDNILTNSFSIAIQPKQNFRFRYVNELNKHALGYISGQVQPTYGQTQSNIVIKGKYPTIRLEWSANEPLDESKRDFFVLCSLHSYKEINTDVHPPLSPHLLMKNGEQTPSYDFIFAPMQENVDKPLERSWQLENFGIVRVTEGNVQQSFSNKWKHYEVLKLKGDLNLANDGSAKASGPLIVCLGFTIYVKDSNAYRLYKKTIYSDNIYNGDDLNIITLCNTSGYIDDRIHILINLPSPKYPYYVRMFRSSSDKFSVEWEKVVRIDKDGIISNNAITYILPAGPPNHQTDKVEVMIEIIVSQSLKKGNPENGVTQSSYRSKPLKFCYLNLNMRENVDGPRKRACRNENSATACLTPARDESLSASVRMSATDPNLMHNMPHSIPVTAEPLAEEPMPNNAENVVAMNSMNIGNQQQDLDILPILYELIHEVPDLQRILDETLESLANDDSTQPLVYSHYSQHRWLTTVQTRKEKEIKGNAILTVRALIKSRIDQINTKGLRGGKNGATTFQFALKDPYLFIYLNRQQMMSPRLKQLILNARNADRQNLLHYACLLDTEYCIRPLVSMGFTLNEQDSLGRTPLHIAIEHNHKYCVKQLQNLLKDHSKYPTEVERQFIQMFEVYNHKGHTVLHAAAIENLYDLMEIMLKFCAAHQIDILRYEALDSGDSIAHLIARRNHVHMVGLIRQYVPQYLSVKNYRGETVLAVQNLSREMLQALKENSDLSEMTDLWKIL